MRCSTPCCFITLQLLKINLCLHLLFKHCPSPEFNINFLVAPALPNIEFRSHLNIAPNKNIFCPCAEPGMVSLDIFSHLTGLKLVNRK